MRKSLGLTESTQLMAISDSDQKEIKIIPLQLYDDKSFIKLKIRMPDKPGSLARIATTFGELGLSLVYGESLVVKKGVEALFDVISPIPEMPLEELKKKLEEQGGAINVEIIEGKVQTGENDTENDNDD